MPSSADDFAAAWPRVLLALVAAAFMAGPAAAAPALDGRTGGPGLPIGWRDDPRAAADGPSVVDPRVGRREQRRQRREAGRRRDVEPLGTEQQPTPEPLVQTWPFAPLAAEPLPRRSVPQPAAAAPRVVVHRDQPSVPRGHDRQRFDLHLPDGCSTGPLPLLVWIHGRDWNSGSKADCPVAWLAEHGYAVASVGYRLVDTARHPAQLDDCRQALVTLRRDAALWGIDGERICVAGSGAGGHLAALVGLADVADGRFRPVTTTADEADAGVAAVCVIGGPVHLTTLGGGHDRAGSAASRLVGGPLPELRELAQHASPLLHVSADDPPTIVMHGTRDTSVPLEQSRRLHAALQAAGVESSLVLLDDAGPEPVLAAGSPAGEALRGFLEHVLGPGRTAAEIDSP